ncbi:MAG TPA: hypothetical protein VHM64_17420, partial [Candidatus Binatia bacterium]|nr:hypothetical protein [Candidatus Binatia bacterium]
IVPTLRAQMQRSKPTDRITAILQDERDTTGDTAVVLEICFGASGGILDEASKTYGAPSRRRCRNC